MQSFRIPENRKTELEEFKQYIEEKGVEHTLPDQVLFRYLYTSKFNKNSASNRLKKLIAWRKENDIDGILNNELVKKNHDIISKRLLYTTHKTDRFGRPCTIFNVGHLNLRHILNHYSAKEILTAHIYYNEYMEKLCREASERMQVDYIGNSTIIDLDGLSLSRHMNLKAMNIFKEMILIHTYYYPESSDVVYVINYPPIFNFFWNIIKPWMTDLQKEKLKRVVNPVNLLLYFKEEDLPKVYGGKCCCENGCVLGHAAYGEPSARTDILSLPNKGIENVDINVETGMMVRWCFSTLDKNIDYRVEYISRDQFIQVIVPLCSVESQSSLITGQWVSVGNGVLRLVFDNSKSSWYSCSISYEISIGKGEDDSASEVSDSPCV